MAKALTFILFTFKFFLILMICIFQIFFWITIFFRILVFLIFILTIIINIIFDIVWVILIFIITRAFLNAFLFASYLFPHFPDLLFQFFVTNLVDVNLIILFIAFQSEIWWWIFTWIEISVICWWMRLIIPLIVIV